MFDFIKKPIFFLPVECTPRELDYKLSLAKSLCQEGFDVIIGNPPFIRDELKYKNFKGGFLEKGVNPDPEYYMNLKRKEILLYCLSDEGAAFPAFSLNYQPAVDALKLMRHIFLWGDFQKDDLLKRNSDIELSAKYIVIGYPGFEFSFPKYKTYHKELKPLFLPDQYILVNTNFGAINGFSLEENLEACSHMSPETKEMLVKSYENETKSFGEFFGWITRIINEFPNETFLIRPHPTEKKSTYDKYFSAFKNAIVSKEGNANQVISTAKIVLHNDCTTALQSYLMEVPVISLSKSNADVVHASWALDFGAQPKSVEEAINLIKYILQHEKFDPDLTLSIQKNAQETLNQRFCNIENSSKDIVSIITAEMKDKWKNFLPYKIVDSRTLIQKIKLFIRKFLPLHYKIPVASRGSLVHFSANDIKKRFNGLQELDGINISYKIKKLYPNTFLISKKN